MNWAYLNQEDDEKIKIGDSSELLKQILGYEVPYGVLQRERKTAWSILLPNSQQEQGNACTRDGIYDLFTFNLSE